MFKVKEAAREEDSLRAWTIMTDCSLYSGKTPFSL
jgi:hypothetical protein